MPNHLNIIFIPNKDVKRAGCSLIKSKQETVSDESHRSTNAKRKDSSLYNITEIMKSLKWYSAKEANKILNSKGKFWQHESYDHVIRNEKELQGLVEYVLNNPVKVGLTDNPYHYEWSYYNPEFMI